jgi:glycosyltransferase involved in cell wall biosynthesis
LIISHETVGARMAGPGIRYWHLARVLAQEFPVVLAAPAGSVPGTGDDFAWIVYNSGRDPILEDAIRRARAALVPAVWLAYAPALLQSDVPLIVDGYNPFTAETFFVRPGEVEAQEARLTLAYLAGDFFICASERQRDWWLGLLEAHGRINVYTYPADPSLRRLIDVVPYGLPEALPRRTRPVVKGIWPGVGEQNRVVLWGGGLWPWLDSLTAIRAASKIRETRSEVQLIFPGTRHPNPAMANVPTHLEAARALAQQLGLLERGVFFGDWVPYEDWPNVLLESDVALTLHAEDTLETRLAFRSRVLDYIWAGLPIVATRGDAVSELITAHDLGIVVKGGDVEATAGAILTLLDTPREVFQQRRDGLRQLLTWERAARPLVDFCRHPWRAPDREALGDRLGNPFYASEAARLRAQLHEYEQMRFVRLARWLHPYRQRLRKWLKRPQT